MKIKKALLFIASFLTIGYSIWSIFFHASLELKDQLSSVAIIAMNATVMIIGAILVYQKQIDLLIRRGWIFISLAALSNTIAECIWYYDNSILGVNPFPSLADFFYLLFYPLTLVGVLLLPYKPLKRLEFITYLFDLSIVMIAFLMVFWYFILAPLHLLSKGGIEGFIAIAYPVGDLLLFTGVIALIQRNSEKTSQWTMIFICLSIILMALPDAVFAYYEINDIPYSISRLNFYWLVSALFMVFAAYKQMDEVQKVNPSLSLFSNRSQRMLRIALPYSAAATGPILLVEVINSSFLTGLQLQGLLLGIIFLVVLILGRQHMVLMDNIQLIEETRNLAITDSLTGVHNRHYFNEVFQQEIERARRYQKTFSLLLLDVDNFKSINDTYGHLQGDKVLTMIAGLISEQVRKTDILARYGGDEFVIILLETDLDDAQKVAQKVEAYILAHSYADIPLSISIGIASYKSACSAEQLLEEADRHLYKNKIETTILNKSANINAS